MLCFLSLGLWLHHRWELLVSHWKSLVRPNSVEMAQNFMCTLLMAILMDLAVFFFILTRFDA